LTILAESGIIRLVMTSVQESLIADCDKAVSLATCEEICSGIKTALEKHLQQAEPFLPEKFCEPATDCYARRLLYKDPNDRYSVVVMVWGVGQVTALHDHAGNWCVEGVYRGRIKVVNYELKNDGEKDGVYKFRKNQELTGLFGEAGALIPPYEYHTIANDDPKQPSVTVHVYRGEMKQFAAFIPTEDGDYKKEIRTTYYTD